jgi:ankyrin repeat protein
MYGARGGRVDNIKVLVEYLHKKDINWRDHKGANVLHFAIKRRSLDTVRYLLELGASLAAVDYERGMPLEYAERLAKNNDELKSIVWVLRYGDEDEVKCAVEE